MLNYQRVQSLAQQPVCNLALTIPTQRPTASDVPGPLRLHVEGDIRQWTVEAVHQIVLAMRDGKTPFMMFFWAPCSKAMS